MGSDCVSIWEANKEGRVCRCKKLAPLAKSLSDQSAHEKPAEKSRQESTTEVLVPWSEAEAGTRPPAAFLQPFLLSALSDRPLNDGKPNLDCDPLRRSRLCMLMGCGRPGIVSVVRVVMKLRPSRSVIDFSKETFVEQLLLASDHVNSRRSVVLEATAGTAIASRGL